MWVHELTLGTHNEDVREFWEVETSYACEMELSSLAAVSAPSPLSMWFLPVMDDSLSSRCPSAPYPWFVESPSQSRWRWR